MSEETVTAAPKKSAKKATKKSAKKAAPKKAAVKREGAGRTSQYAGMKLTKLVNDNPRREGTHGYNSFKAIKNGMTYEKYIEAGGRLQDLAYDIAHKFVKVSK